MFNIIYFRQRVKIILKNNQSKQKNNISLLFLNFFLIFNFYLRPVNTRGLNNVKEHKVNRKNGKGANICGFHMYSKFFIKLSADRTWAVIGGPLFNLMFKNI